MRTATLGLARGGLELRQFFRNTAGFLFTFALPVFLLLLLGSIFSGQAPGAEFTQQQEFTASMIGAGIISTTFITLGTGIAQDRENGTLKRLHGTPLPLASYFVGKVVLVLVLSLAEAVLVLLTGVLVFDVDLPADPARWLTFAWVFGLGTISCALLGIAVSSVAGSARSAPTVLNLPYVGLQFVSGVFISVAVLPQWMVVLGSLFPLKWVAQGFRSVLLPEGAAVVEVAGSWEHGRTALVLVAWCVAGLALCAASFRWTNGRSGG
ncbi:MULTISPECIES: ABC transporter permease [Actinosynnema]|uniref:ABC transporter permease n=1 Tax=Actinosynnema TaxID=40566 RepID=UPI0020A49CCD|nr:ABC transporter permease [Actinosynnema pretiosum]MCP2095863.1 ABC-2 type transport system permease protein [Actinosynnema pretiosum]